MPITISSRRRLRYVAMNIYTKINNRIRDFILKAKRLEGDPHFIALGLAIGVFVGFTPTIPFHTVLAVALAFLFKGSKAAADRIARVLKAGRP